MVIAAIFRALLRGAIVGPVLGVARDFLRTRAELVVTTPVLGGLHHAYRRAA